MGDDTNETIYNTTVVPENLVKSVSVLEHNMDQFLLIIMGLCLLFMQSGFALLEAGSVRSKNVTNILIKNVCDSFICGVSYWLFGYALAYGDGNQFIGQTYFAITGLPDSRYGFFFFQFAFTATAATIVSGAMAERCEFMPYFIFSFIMTGFIYPLVTHWTWWPNGFLIQGMDYGGDIGRVGYRDFSGSGVVHTVGGTAALVGAAILGPRIGRFDPETGAAVFIRGHSIPLSTLGGFILFFGFLTFNGASQMSLSKEGDGEAISLAIVNTMITATFASFTATFVYRVPRFGSGAWCITVASNGAITGMISSCAGCNVLYPWGSCALGITAGILYHVWCWFVRIIRVDDPVDAVAMNLGGGTLGVIAVGLLDRYKGVLIKWNRHSGLFLGWQLAGMVVIICWTAFWSAISIGIMRWMKILRVPEDIELKGLDIPRHKEPGYPVESYGHGHVEKIIQILESTPMEVFQGYTNMGMTVQELNDKGPYEHPEIAAESRRNSMAIYTAESRRNSIAMHDVHIGSVLRKTSMSIHELHEKGSHEHPEWRPPLSHQMNHTITEVNENGADNNSNFTMIHPRQGSIGYELGVSIENPEIKEKVTNNGHVLYQMGENDLHAFQKDKTTSNQAASVTVSPYTITKF
ncbi:hypothetical protein CHS0354_008235 [Potamilus streckersoni]|uniref:Ammonium transporter n=1 Tax=Potamilus streckersoni TaxID=2493646 RepID=A0AAE0VL88_9BIVA|nr:hypothetical protein CHS0354_008235 [Potamilus streckersoni]